jgi:hypothetical protein
VYYEGNAGKGAGPFLIVQQRDLKKFTCLQEIPKQVWDDSGAVERLQPGCNVNKGVRKSLLNTVVDQSTKSTTQQRFFKKLRRLAAVQVSDTTGVE